MMGGKLFWSELMERLLERSGWRVSGREKS